MRFGPTQETVDQGCVRGVGLGKNPKLASAPLEYGKYGTVPVPVHEVSE